MRRREFIAGLGATVWPLRVAAQPLKIPVIGFLHPGTLDQWHTELAAFHRGLAETGYVEGRNVAIENRKGAGHHLPADTTRPRRRGDRMSGERCAAP
jgi:putative tryptophan/tyrosine transport system substrate-binding protein